jgi:hypothetical protein
VGFDWDYWSLYVESHDFVTFYPNCLVIVTLILRHAYLLEISISTFFFALVDSTFRCTGYPTSFTSEKVNITHCYSLESQLIES